MSHIILDATLRLDRREKSITGGGTLFFFFFFFFSEQHFMFLIFFLLMENLGAMAYSRYTGFHEITDRDVLELHCINVKNWIRTDINDDSYIPLSYYLEVIPTQQI